MMDVRDNITADPDNSTDNQSGSDEPMTVDQYLWIYCLPIIFVIGVCGNVFTILVMRRKRMRGTATSIYLTVMAIADTAVLVTGIVPEWLNQMQIVNLGELHPWVCKIERFLFYGTGDVAIWILVAFSCDRFIAVCFPLKKRQYCTPQRAKLACLVILLVAIVKNLHVFWTRGVVYDNGEFIENCGKPEPYRHFEKKVRPWIVLALVSLGPFLIILACNVMIVKTLFFSARLRNSSSAESSKAFTQTTAMCLSTSFAFLILITPSIVLYIGKPNWTDPLNPNKAYDIAKAINNQLVYVNHSINFFLYCLTGRRFRDEFVAMFSRGRDQSARTNMNGQRIEYSMSTSAAMTSNKSSSVIPNTPTFIGLRKSRSKKVPSSDSESSEPDIREEEESLCKNGS